MSIKNRKVIILKLAFISDIHGNAIALDAVSKDIKRKCRKSICTGGFMLSRHGTNVHLS